MALVEGESVSRPPYSRRLRPHITTKSDECNKMERAGSARHEHAACKGHAEINLRHAQ